MRMSCREGVCGSDAMNINGKNGLACVTKLADLKLPYCYQTNARTSSYKRFSGRYDSIL